MEEMTLYHNPDCGTSRNVLAIIRHAGIEPHVIEYLKTPPTKSELLNLLNEMQISPRQLLRTNVPAFQEYGLDDLSVDDESILAAMVKEPILINRPIVISKKGTRLCRPSEAVLDILPTPLPSPYVKEDGQIVYPK